MPRPRIFISFSSKDILLVRRLFARLDAQPLDLWDYSEEGQEIPGGENIMDYLKQRIERCDFFIPVVSQNAFSSNYARREVEHALSIASGGGIRILPVVASECRTEEQWPSPYRELSELRYYAALDGSRTDFEEMILGLCRDMGVPYSPLIMAHPHLPFMDRFSAEIANLLSKRPEHENATQRKLMQIQQDFEAAYERGDYVRALSLISYFVLTCEYEFPEERLYYPYVVKGVCEISRGRLLEATQTFRGLMNHPKLDENVYGALGHIKHEQGAYREALEYYRIAEAMDPADPAAKAGVLANAVMCGETVDIDEFYGRIKEGGISWDEDRIKIDTLMAHALAVNNRLDEAARILETLIREGEITSKITVNLAQVLKMKGQTGQGLSLLRKYEDVFPDDPDYLHALASFFFYMRDHKNANDTFTRLVDKFPYVRQYRIDAAQARWISGDREEARRIVEPVLNTKIFPPPETENDYFCDGFANWFHERYERADYDFERSNFPSEKHYQNIMNTQ